MSERVVCACVLCPFLQLIVLRHHEFQCVVDEGCMLPLALGNCHAVCYVNITDFVLLLRVALCNF